ncbi:hypothetical protein EYF80_054556 [Liparis tanakae]|uniref:Uncharacterized protein n=1 Tax=Liparis tanakae TaxID=230148 RepID=A0A4Z2F3C5_9TELE|nr:hypothetical protein EYF80_054556 [Liparis tanakae]
MPALPSEKNLLPQIPRSRQEVADRKWPTGSGRGPSAPLGPQRSALHDVLGVSCSDESRVVLVESDLKVLHTVNGVWFPVWPAGGAAAPRISSAGGGEAEQVLTGKRAV